MRRIYHDRGTASAITVLAVLLFLLQGLFAGLAQGAMAVSAGGSLHDLCLSSDTGALDPAPGTDPHPAKGFECPCATLCRLSVHALPSEGQAGLGSALQPAIAILYRPLTTVLSPALRGWTAKARAPPLLP